MKNQLDSMSKNIAFAFLFLIAAAFAEEGSPIECNCHAKTVQPVCGDDKRTYDNADVVKCVNKCQNTNVMIVAHEPCSCVCAINKMFLPVCATNKKSYVNPDAIRCHNRCNYPPVTIDFNGKCHEDDVLLNN